MADILFVDDDAELIQSLIRVLARLVSPHTICAAGSARRAMELCKTEEPCVAVIDLCLDERKGVDSGFELLVSLRTQYPGMRILVLTGHGTQSNGIKAMRLGAASFLEKPVNPEHLAALIRDAHAQAYLRREYERLTREGIFGSGAELCGMSQAVVALREDVAFAASTAQPVLLLGETGTGKSLCARLIHQQSARRLSKFVHYHPNFGGGDIVQSELFGHIKGAFTGAVAVRKGLAIEAHGGTLFIDELDAVPLDTQVLLLDLIQEQRIRPVGADTFQSINCRIIAATNKPIADALAMGVLREDLHHRIAHNIIRIPPLRERVDDIPELVTRTLQRLRDSDGINVFEVDERLMTGLQEYAWPGNIRELQGVIETGAYRAQFRGRSTILTEDVAFGGIAARSQSSHRGLDQEQELTFHEKVEAFKRELVCRALKESSGNQVQAAQILGVDRGTIRRLSEKQAG